MTLEENKKLKAFINYLKGREREKDEERARSGKRTESSKKKRPKKIDRQIKKTIFFAIALLHNIALVEIVTNCGNSNSNSDLFPYSDCFNA